MNATVEMALGEIMSYMSKLLQDKLSAVTDTLQEAEQTNQQPCLEHAQAHQS